MNLSKRLQAVADFLTPCDTIADIGTDHGYIPIYIMEKKLSRKVIASDINKGPIETAKKNLKNNNINAGVETRIGGGFDPYKLNEINIAIISGMGGNLIGDIIKESRDIAKNLDFLILQPAQHQEVLRKYLYENNFKIEDENVVFDAGKYYHTLKVSYGKDVPYDKEIYYYTGRYELKRKNDDFLNYLNKKIESLEKVIKYTESACDKSRYNEMKNLILAFKEVKSEYEM